MDNPFAELLNDLAKEIRENEAKRERPVNLEFHSQEEAFTYYRRLASLQPGETLKYKTTHGEKTGIFVKFTDAGMPMVFGCDDGKYLGIAISPMCVIFDEEIYDDDGDIEEFHRT